MKKKNLVSIIMNCHNGEKYLQEALFSLMNQTYRNWELIFFDNASNDRSSEILKKFKDKRIRYFYSSFINLGSARKIALTKCRGDFIAFLDCDDYWNKNKLKFQIKDLLKYPSYGISFTNSYFFNKKYKKKLYSTAPYDGQIFEKLLKKYYISFDTVLIRNIHLQKLKSKFDQRLNIVHDLDLLIRLSMSTKFKYLNKCLSWWRIHENSFSKNKISTINNEKILFFNKLKKLLKNSKNKKKYLNLFRENILQSQIEEYLINKNIKKFFKVIFFNKKINLKKFIFLFLILIPGGNIIYKHFKKSW